MYDSHRAMLINRHPTVGKHNIKQTKTIKIREGKSENKLFSAVQFRITNPVFLLLLSRNVHWQEYKRVCGYIIILVVKAIK